MSDDQAALSTEQVAELAGATARQIWYWADAGYLIPEGGHPKGLSSNGYRFEWPEAEVRVACRMARLVRAGLTVEKAATFARYEWPEGDLSDDGIRLVIADG